MNENKTEEPKERATELAAGVTLWTRDGEITGNAIVMRYDFEKNAWLVRSDYGDRFFFSTEEVMAKFKLGYQKNFGDWAGSQFSMIFANTPWPHLKYGTNRDIAEKAFADFAKEEIQEHEAYKKIREAKAARKAAAHPPKQRKQKNPQPDSQRNGNALGKSFVDIQSGSGYAGNIFDQVFNKGARREKVTN
jgi:hypothetical protein